MNKLKIAGLAVLAILLGLSFFLFTSSAVAEFTDDVPLEHKNANAEVYAALVSAGIDSPFVDVDSERAYVAYELPDGYDSETMQRFAIGAAGGAAVEYSQKIIAVQYQDGIAKIAWAVNVEDLKALVRQELSESEFESRVQKQPL